MQAERQQAAADEEGDGYRAARAHIVPQHGRIAQVDEHCLQPALVPARPLRIPDLPRHRRLFIGGAVEGGTGKAEAGKAQAKVGIFRHIVGVPPACGNEGRAAEMV